MTYATEIVDTFSVRSRKRLGYLALVTAVVPGPLLATVAKELVDIRPCLS